MPKYLIQGSYTAPAGVQGLLKEGGSSRIAAATQLIEGLGGTVESAYFAFGESDVVLIVDMPGSVAAAAAALTVTSSGAVSLTTTPLITPEEIDEAAGMSASYRPPGQ
jgi:uncharacterized protein with GYD domain